MTKEKATAVRSMIDAYLVGYVKGIEDVKDMILDVTEVIMAKTESFSKTTKRKIKTSKPAAMSAKRKPGRPKKA